MTNCPVVGSGGGEAVLPVSPVAPHALWGGGGAQGQEWYRFNLSLLEEGPRIIRTTALNTTFF